MEFRYVLPQLLIQKASWFAEFANGGMQVTIMLRNGQVYERALLSNCSAIVAMRGYSDLPFAVDEIQDIYQSEEDKCPHERGNWEYWDKWS